MKNIIKSLVIVVAVAAVASVATYAYFTASDTVSGNTASAGSIKVKLNPGTGTTFPMQIANLQPGVWTTNPFKVEVYNKNTPESTMAVKYKMSAVNPTETVVNFYSKIWVRAATSNCISSPPNWTLTPSLVKYEGPLSGFNVDSSQAISPTLNVNISHCWQLSFALASDTGNGFQGASSTFGLKLDATQPENPGWTE